MRVPVMYGDSSRQAATILANNSASNLPSTPLISYYISGLEYDQKRTQDPTFVEKLQIRQREYNQETQQYETFQGQAFTVERIMPVPYTLKMTVDFWSTNYQQKTEVFEQLGTLFNPGFEIQSTDNFIDWTSLSVVYQESLNFSSRTIPQGTGNAIEVMTWKFYMPIWISSPAKLKRMGIIQKIISSIYQGNKYEDIDGGIVQSRQKITPHGYNLLYMGNTLQLLPQNESFIAENSSTNPIDNPDSSLYWPGMLDEYGTIKPGISQIWLQNPYMDTDIVGTFVIDPNDARLLIFDVDIDTLPQDTLDPVVSVIDPLLVGPGAGLPAAAAGVRYIIVEDMGAVDSPTPAWGSVIAHANDIIEYTGSAWEVSFNSGAATEVQYCTNLATLLQYRYVDGTWMKSVSGYYAEGDFSVVI